MTSVWLALASEPIRRPKPHGDSLSILWATLPLVGVILLCAAVIHLVKRWRERTGPAKQATSSDQLAHFRVLYERGELSAEEYGKIRSRLGERMRKELEAQASADPAAPAESSGPAGNSTPDAAQGGNPPATPGQETASELKP